MVERIIKKIIDDKVDIDKILVVTFTNAAAAEMRERILDAIYKKIEENPDDTNLQRQIILLNKASICTIDSFCLDVIKNNFYELDVSANTRIADSTEVLLLKQETLDDIFEEKYIANDKDFISLIDTYTSYNKDEDLKDLILRIYSYTQSAPFPEDWLEQSVEMLNVETENFATTVWGEIITKRVNQILEDGINSLKNMKKKMELYQELDKFANVISDDIIQYSAIQENLSDWDKAQVAVQTLNTKNWPVDKKVVNDLKDEAKEVRDEVKDNIKEVKELMECSSEDAINDLNFMHEILTKLKNLIIEFSERFYKKKREKNLMDFNDMEHLALNLLVKKDEHGNPQKTEIAKRYMEKFEEIAIDEYQDSNLAQEFILTSVSNGKNVFMVGDVKQSIYKFRQARPQLFLDKYNTYKIEPSDGEDRKIQLFKNFRSRQNILDFTNLVFKNIMSKSLGDIDYNEDEYLNLGASYEPVEGQNFKTEINIIDLAEEEETWKDSTEEEPQNERVEDVVLEARFVANKIKALIESKYMVFDKKQKCERPIKYRDIAILLRSVSGVASVYEKEISELGIPVYSDSSGEYLQSVEIDTIMSLLRIINNPMQDIPLVTVMRSPIGNFTDNELIEIRMYNQRGNFYQALTRASKELSSKKEGKIIEAGQEQRQNERLEENLINENKNEESEELKEYKNEIAIKKSDNEKLKNKIDKFLNLLDELRKDEQYMALDEWIWNIYNKTGYMDYVSLMPNGNLRISNLKMLFERAKQYESASFKGLYNFINFIDKINFNSEDLKSAKIIGENEDVVRIMTIHKSKGLEFPVVILAGTGKQFNFRDLNEKILLDQDLGFGPQYVNSEKHIEYKTLAKKALAIKARNEAVSEEMRVLYVALTRPKEKLIIVGRQKDANKSISQKQKLLEGYREEKIDSYIIEKYKTYLDWFELIYVKEGAKKTKENFSMDIIKKKTLMKEIKHEEIEEEKIVSKIDEIARKTKIESSEEDRIKQILSWKYKFEGLEQIPTKTSVTKIKEQDLWNEEEKTKLKINQAFEEITNSDEEKESKVSTSITAKPKFLNEEAKTKISNAEKGTLMHLCVQKMDEKQEYDLQKIDEMLLALETKEIITGLEAENIDKSKLLEYTKSELWQELKEAKEIQKEHPFYINVKASAIYENISKEADEKILVQGVIDLYFINKNDELVLIDYKTDYVPAGQEFTLVEKYKKQLELYKVALEQSLKRKVDKMAIYSLYLNKLIEMK